MTRFPFEEDNTHRFLRDLADAARANGKTFEAIALDRRAAYVRELERRVRQAETWGDLSE